MPDFKESIYKEYHKVHTKYLYGEATSGKIENQFNVWKYYFGDYLPQDKSISILDAGCGYGGFVYWLNQVGYKNATGVDVSEELFSISQKLKITNIICGDVFEFLGNNKDRYDIIFARDILEHFTKEKIYELGTLFFNSLKKDGVLIIQVPNGQSPSVGRIFHSDFTHETLFTYISVRQIFSTIGFSSYAFKEVTPVPKGLFSVIRFILWKILRTSMRIYQAIETGNLSGYFSQNLIAVIKKHS